jgi:acyl-CoA reductase-like NAD-dependent aldehyde dehydrogenase
MKEEIFGSVVAISKFLTEKKYSLSLTTHKYGFAAAVRMTNGLKAGTAWYVRESNSFRSSDT